jgi:hypothetical protein
MFLKMMFLLPTHPPPACLQGWQIGTKFIEKKTGRQ